MENAGELVEIGSGIDRFNEAAGEDADEGDLLGETLVVCVLDTGEITLFEAAGVEAVLEGVDVTELTAWAARGRGHGVDLNDDKCEG